jgi:aspartate/methionine/tyrosine aminotransferase
MKLGWINVSGPCESVAKAVEGLELISDTFLSAGTPIMNASEKLLDAESEILSIVRNRMNKNLEIYSEVLEYANSPHRILVCEGAWTALVQSPRFAGEDTLAIGLLRKEGIYVQPGHFFDMEREAFFAFSLILEPSIARHAALGYDKFFQEFM